MLILLILLTALASLPPLLTAAHLWQIKEWRWDRLREHFRSEGLLRQIFGTLRPLMLVLTLPFLWLSWLSPQTWTISSLTLLTLLGLAQIILDRQPMPKWTMKSLTLTAGATALSLVTALFLLYAEHGFIALPFHPLLQPFFLVVAWIIFRPLDLFLKRRVLQRAQILREQHPDLIVIGITGSVGKTTTKELLMHILQSRGAASTPAYVNTEMGVAQWLTTTLSKPEVSGILIVEMGAYKQGEIALLCRVTKPTIGVITFIGTQHIALFGSQEKLLTTKAELFDALPGDGIAILNSDSPFADTLKAKAHCSLMTVSTGERADLCAIDIEEMPMGIHFRAGDAVFNVPLHGTHNVSNILLAVAAAESLGMKRRDIARILSDFQPPKHTFSVRAESGITLLDDTHNASAASFKAAIGWAKGQPMEEKVLLTSGLIELGESEDRTHAELGMEAAGIFDRVIFTHPRHSRSFAQGFGKPVEIVDRDVQPVHRNALLVCIGRVPEETVKRLMLGGA
ncbi:MAG: UDP-N-acetylmuramoyl-tripeptide--D-alanyl-D-alanine ligase [Candidatus Peregrinibacteria bacterium]